MTEFKKPSAKYVAKVKAMADEVRKISYADIAGMDAMHAKLWRVQMEYNGYVDVMENGKKIFYELKA